MVSAEYARPVRRANTFDRKERKTLIEVSHLTKRYGSHTAVKDLSFTIEKGVIYGFLGPNGAGKSTTMNILTGCLGASEGEVKIGGHSIVEEPEKAKRLIGYLPELPPLYPDMTPAEYLMFVASAKGIGGKEREQQVRAAMEKTKITDVRHRMIRNLSKGYKQRVGIAQALIGNPEVIILDEPTVGLDPAQIIEIRELIRELGRDHTMILSSHILSEVQAVCDSIMIISHGELVASDTPENLTTLFAGRTTCDLLVRADEAQAREVLAQVEGVESVQCAPGEEGTVKVTVTPADETDLRETLFYAFAEARKPILEMTHKRASLEDVFLELTQEKPREETEKRRRLRKKAEKQEKEAEEK